MINGFYKQRRLFKIIRLEFYFIGGVEVGRLIIMG